jgi:hypothetical protein
MTTAQEIVDNAKAAKPKAKAKAKAHDNGLNASISEAQLALQSNRQAIIAKAIADQDAEDKTLYFNARLAASQNNVAFFESIDYQDLSLRAAKKTANILRPTQTPLQLASSEVVIYPKASDWLDQLDGDDE